MVRKEFCCIYKENIKKIIVFPMFNPQRTGVFYKRKGRGGGPPVISARSNGKRLILSGYEYFVKRKIFCKRVQAFGHYCLN